MCIHTKRAFPKTVMAWLIGWPIACLIAGLGAALLAGCDGGDGGDGGAPPGQPRYSAAPAPDALPEYRIAILPLHNPHRSHAVFEPLARYLQARIPGARFEFEAAMDFSAFEQKLRDRTVAFALPNPYQTLLALRHGYHVLAKVAEDEDFRGLIVVRRDSPVTTVAELKGKVVAYPAPTALAAALQAQHFLQRNGLDVNRDVENRYVGSQDSSILAVHYRQADAGATWPPTWRLFLKSHPAEAAQLKVAWQTESLPNLPFMARDDIPGGLQDKVRAALFGMHKTAEGRAVLAAMEFSGFVPADDGTYEPVRRFARDFSAHVRPIETYD